LIEPHEQLLTKPSNDTLLYKIVPSKFFFDMLRNDYLYFRRVDTYHDDNRDSEQPDNHNDTYGKKVFEKDPTFTLTDYYNRCRARTYACCFTTENTKYIEDNYSNGDPSCICLVFQCGKFIEQLNSIYNETKISFKNQLLENFFYINYGLVTYGKFNNFISKRGDMANPIEFAYFKDEDKYSKEKEFRITLSTHGMPKAFQLPDKSKFSFPDFIKIELNFKEALISNALKMILISKNHSTNFRSELEEQLKLNNIDINFINS
tara:strand:+ start:2757 stop:3542 length:786 start_codon:yes stop_codon:yes gene_type:complete